MIRLNRKQHNDILSVAKHKKWQVCNACVSAAVCVEYGADRKICGTPYFCITQSLRFCFGTSMIPMLLWTPHFWIHLPKLSSDITTKNSLSTPFLQFVHCEPKKQKSLDFSRLLGYVRNYINPDVDDMVEAGRIELPSENTPI
ncbi:MAG: hypothetical protein ACRCZK_02120 [Oscillospiraceae bacterium]